jgi:hypothetical protein
VTSLAVSDGTKYTQVHALLPRSSAAMLFRSGQGSGAPLPSCPHIGRPDSDASIPMCCY